MKKLIVVILILLNLSSFGQSTTQILTGPTTKALVKGGLQVDSLLSFPQDTIMRANWPKTLPAIGYKNGKAYLWSPIQQKYVELAGADSSIYATRYWSATQYALLGHNHDAAYAPISGSGNYIQNQTAAAQSASYNISGTGQAAYFKLTGAVSDPTGSNGLFNYNLTSNQFRGYRNGAWRDVLMSGDIGATNGLTASGNSVKLGGVLTEATTISNSVSGGAGYDLIIRARNTNNFQFTRLVGNSNGWTIDQTSPDYATGSGYLLNVNATGALGSINSGVRVNAQSTASGTGKFGLNVTTEVKTSAASSTTLTNYGARFTANMTGDGGSTVNSRTAIAAYFQATNVTTGTNQNNSIYAIYSDGGTNYYKDKVIIDNLKSGGTPPTTTGTTKMVVSDANGLLSIEDKPTGGTQVNADWNATSGVEQILNKPTFTTDRILFGDGTSTAATSANLTYSGSTLTNNGATRLNGAVYNNTQTLTGSINTTLTDGFSYVNVDASSSTTQANIYLPDISSKSGIRYVIKKIDSSAIPVVISPNGTQNIEGATSITLADRYDAVVIYTEGEYWYIESSRGL